MYQQPEWNACVLRLGGVGSSDRSRIKCLHKPGQQIMSICPRRLTPGNATVYGLCWYFFPSLSAVSLLPLESQSKQPHYKVTDPSNECKPHQAMLLHQHIHLTASLSFIIHAAQVRHCDFPHQGQRSVRSGHHLLPPTQGLPRGGTTLCQGMGQP